MSDIEQSELDMENSEFNPLDHFAVRQRAAEIRAQATRTGLKAIGYFVATSGIPPSRRITCCCVVRRSFGSIPEIR